MDTNAAKRIVRETFQNPFDKERFIKFIKELFNKIEVATFVYRGNTVPQAYQPFIHTLERLGKYTDAEGNKLDILIVRLKKVKSIEHARTMQRNFVAWYLNGSRGGELKDAAVVAFYTDESEDWRFSLIKMDYQLGKDAKGKSKITKDLTPAKRFSFLVGKNENSHTAQKQLLPILEDDQINPLLSDLETAFNIEIVTKEFFNKYRELFIEVKEALDKVLETDSKIKQEFSSKAVETADFAKKLLGQIVFLYFLQKKGWFGVERDSEWGTGPKDFLRRLYVKRYCEYKNFFNDVLEPLFYNALALERQDNWSDRFNCKIPFLNGGLFDPLRNYDWVHTDIELPNDLFSNEIKDLKTGDIGTGILDIFDRYNFTVKEDEPLEKEVAVDPEMLGKVFENLLEVKDRKSKGTYYTPREIVHYMCQQSLINYLATEFENNIPKEEIEQLVKYGELIAENEAQVEKLGKETETYYHQLSKNIYHSAADIDYKLANIKVCDPAIGSGAFPVGMMSEIVKARNVLSNYLPAPHAEQIAAYQESRTIYNFKRDCIQNSLYGVDIDPGAVEIAKLRLWLSLIVDEEDIKDIKPLPNLDYKIMQGNSLLEEFEGVKLFDERLLESPIIDARIFQPDNQKIISLQGELLKFYMKNPEWMNNKDAVKPLEVVNMETQLRAILKEKKRLPNNSSIEQKDLFASVAESKQIRDELENLHKKFFEETNKRTKEELKRKIENLEWDLIEASLEENKKTSELKKLEQLKQTNTKPFFLWKLNFAEVFQQKGGFDVVIANPPYNAQLSNEERNYFKERYSSVKTGRQDTAAIFVQLAENIGNYKMQFSYILPYRLFSRVRNHGEFQKYVLSSFAIKNIVYLGSDVDFTANDEFMILIMSHGESIGNNKIGVLNKPGIGNLGNNIFTFIQQSNFIEAGQINLNLLKYDENIICKVKKNSLQLNQICEVKDGIVPYIREKLVSQTKKDDRYVKFAGIAGKYILQKYFFKRDELWLCYDIDEAKKYIKDIAELRKVQLRDKSIFGHRKIITSQNSSMLKGTIDDQAIFVSNSIHSTYIKDEFKDSYYLEYILALINSNLINYFHNSLRTKGTDLHPQILVGDLKKLPIKETLPSEQEAFAKIVKEIFKITKTSDYLTNNEKQAKVTDFEHQIDEMVYKLYGLTYEEIKIVEDNQH